MPKRNADGGRTPLTGRIHGPRRQQCGEPYPERASPSGEPDPPHAARGGRALPLVETFLGPEGWDAFGRAIRKTQGLRAGAEYLPWVLDGAPIATQAKVLGLLPPLVTLLYRLVWAPKSLRAPRWDGFASG